MGKPADSIRLGFQTCSKRGSLFILRSEIACCKTTDITWTTEESTRRDLLRYEAQRVSVVQACCAFLGSPVDIIDKFAYLLQVLVQGHRHAAEGGNSPDQRPTASADNGTRHKHCDIGAVTSQVRSEHLLLTMLINPLNTMRDPQFFEYLTQPGADVWSELQNAIRSPPSCGVITSQVEGPLRRARIIAEILRGRTLFVLDDGNIYLCPDRVRVGDVLFFAPPFSDYLLFRSTGTSLSDPTTSGRDGSQKPESLQDGSRTYEFIACPYVHGLSYNTSRNLEFEERVYGMDSEPIRMI